MSTRRPTLADLETGLADLPAGDDDYSARIAAHLLGIVEREQQGGDALAAAELALLQSLPESPPSMEALAVSIREAAIPTTQELIALLLEIARQRVAIDNPRYATLQKIPN